MAIKEFVIGPQNYFKQGYFDGDYTERQNQSFATVSCDAERIVRIQVETGDYYAEGYFDGDYVERRNLSFASLECEADRTVGFQFLAGFYFEQGFIEEGAFGTNSLIFSLAAEAMVVQEATINATSYFQDGYFELGYYKDSGSRFSLTIKLGETVEAFGSFTSEFTAIPTVGKLQSAEIDMDALFAPSVTANVTLRPQVFLEESIDFTATASKFTGYESLQEFFAALNAQADRTRSYDTALSASFDATTDAARLRETDASLAVSFEQITNVTATLDGTASLDALADITVDAIATKFVDFAADLAVTADLVARPITYQLRPSLYPRPVDLDSAPYIFDSNLKQFGTHSLRVDRALLERTQITTSVVPANGENCVIEVWFNPDGSLLADFEPAFVTYGAVTSRDLRNFNSNDFSWGFGRTDGINAGGSPVPVYYQFKFWHGNNIYVLTDQTLFNTRTTQNNGWTNLVFVRENNVGKFYVNNILQQQVNLASNATFRTPSTVDLRRIYLGGPFTILSETTRGANYDELRIARNTVTRKTWSAAATNDENTVLLHHFDNSALDDLDFVVTVQANLAATTAITVDANIQNTGAALLASSGTLTADITVFSAVEASLDSEFSLASTIGAIKQFDISVNALFTPSVETIAINPAETDLFVTVELVAEFDILQIASADLISESSLIANANTVGNATANFNSTSALTVEYNFVPADEPRNYIFRSESDFSAIISSSQELPKSNNTSPLIWANITFSADSDVLPRVVSDYIAAQQIIYRSGNFVVSVQDTKTFGTPTLLTNLNLGTSSGNPIRFTGISQGRYLVLAYGFAYKIDGTFYQTTKVWYKPISSLTEIQNVHSVIVPRINPVPNLIENVNSIPVITDATPYHNGSQTGWASRVVTTIGGGFNIYQNPRFRADPELPLSFNSITPIARWHRLWIKQQETVDVNLLYSNGNIPMLPLNGQAGMLLPDIYVDASNATLHNVGESNALLDFSNGQNFNWDFTNSGEYERLQYPPREAYALVESKFAIDAALERLIESDVININSNANIITDGIRIRFADTALQVVSTVDANATKAVEAFSSAIIESAISCEISKFTGYVSDQSVDSTLTADNTRLKFAQADLTATATLTIDAVKTIGIVANLESQVQQTTLGTRIRFAEPELDAIATVLSVTAKTADFFVNAEVFAQLAVEANKTVDDLFSLESIATVDADAVKSVAADAQLVSTVEINVDVEKIKNVDVVLESTANINVDSVKTVTASSTLDVTFTSETTPIRIRFNTVTLNTLSNVTVEIDVLVNGAAELSSEFVGVFAFGRVRRITETFTAEGFVLTVGDVVNIDSYRQLIVPAESRSIKVRQENNTIVVPTETRILIL